MEQNNNNYKVYTHRDSEGKVFYVGCTKDKYRPFRKYNTKSPKRSLEWFERCNNDFTVEIVAEGLSQELAYELEEFMIAEYGRECDGGVLVNKSTGGHGSNGTTFKHSNETKEVISQSLKGRVFTAEHKQKLSESGYKRFEKEVRTGSNNPRSKKVICIVTGKVWGCVKDCALDNNINYNTLAHKLNGNNTNNTNFKYLNNEKTN